MTNYARLCTATPGVVTETGPHIVLCPPEAGCTDAVVTLGARGKWRTAAGTTAAAWYRKNGGR